jgi:ABC-type uncharacterized transport system involved in gliding motility auxiliary subunit
MNSSWIKTRQTKYGAYLTIYILVVLAIVVGANWLANANNKSFDTTANKRFSLSDATKKVVSGLKNDVNITYFDRDRTFENARATLDRYKDLSSKIKVNYIDPEKKPDLATLAHVRQFGTIFVDNGANHEEAKALTEEEITGAIKRSLSSGVRTACFITGSGEGSISDTERDGFSFFKDALEKSKINSKELPMLQKAEIDPACTILVIAGPTHDYIAPVTDAIKKFVENGGKAMFLLRPTFAVRGEGGQGEPGLEKMLADWGVGVVNDLIYDLGPLAERLGPETVLVAKYDSHPIVREMGNNATVFPLARKLEVKGDKPGIEKLFETSEYSYETTNLTPPIKVDPDKDKKGPFTLGAAGTINGKGRIVVVGSSRWLSNYALSLPLSNRDLGLNMINWLTADESLITIPTKEPEDRRILLSGRQMNVVALSSVIVLPLLVVFSGFAVWWKRR